MEEGKQSKKVRQILEPFMEEIRQVRQKMRKEEWDDKKFQKKF